MRAEERDGRRAAELGGQAGFDPDDALLFVPVAMLLGWDMYLITTAAIGASVFAVFFFWKFSYVFNFLAKCKHEFFYSIKVGHYYP